MESQQQQPAASQEPSQLKKKRSGTKPTKEKKKLRTNENGEIDITSNSLSDIIAFGRKVGKPTKAALEREEAKKRELNNINENAKRRKTSHAENGTDINKETTSDKGKSSTTTSVTSSDFGMGDEEEVIGTIENEEEETAEKEKNQKKDDTNTTEKEKTNNNTNEEAPSEKVGPQVRIINGQIVLDEESLVVTEQENTGDYSTVFESGSNVTYSSYTNRDPICRWSAEETDRFYAALKKYGTDFALIEMIFPNRNRRQLRNKFKREEKLNPKKILSALSKRDPIDIDEHRAQAKLCNKLPEPKPKNTNTLASITQDVEDEENEAADTNDNDDSSKQNEKNDKRSKNGKNSKKNRKNQQTEENNNADDEEVVGEIDGATGETKRYDDDEEVIGVLE